MRIAFLAAANSIHTVRWVNALAERGHDILLLSLQKNTAPLHAGVTLKRLPIPAPLGYFLNTATARFHLQNFQAEMIHAHYASGYGTLARKLNLKPLLLSVWGSDIFAFPKKSRWHRQLLIKNLKAADRVASTSHVMAQETRKYASELSLSVTPFGVDVQAFTEPVKKNKGPLVLGTVKTLAPVYGIADLIQAFALAYQQGLPQDARLMIVGEGPQRKALQELAQQKGVSANIDFIGYVPHDEVPYYLHQMDVYLALSHQESFGVAILEASACGLPVIASDVGGLPEVVLSNETGFLTPVQDPDAVAQKILQLAADEALRYRMGARGRAFVCERYSWSASVLLLEGIYQELLSGD